MPATASHEIERAQPVKKKAFFIVRIREGGNCMSEVAATIRVRMSANDAHYGGQLVNGAHMLSLFGDLATELAIQCDGDEGLLVGYENVEFLAPLYAGDFVEAIGRITQIGSTSRRMEFEARKVITARPDISDSAADVLEEPVIIGRAVGTT